MDIRTLTGELSVAPQILLPDLKALQAAGFRSIVCNRPDGEGADQPTFAEIERSAAEHGLQAHYLPCESGKVTDEQGAAFAALMAGLPKPVLAYCRTGMRSTTLWALAQAGQTPLPQIIERSAKAGYDLKGVVRRIVNGGRTPVEVADATHQVVIVGGGAAGISVAASLLARSPGLDVAIIDPADIHYYQPGWTLVGGGVFDAATTARTMASVLPRGVHWIKSAVAAFEPERKAVILDGCRVVRYEQLVVCPGLKLDWHAIDGLIDTLGRNGVTSNYRYDLAPYTWHLVQQLHRGRAIFSQPPMPIKCAGAPQKAMYLSADHWRRQGVLGAIDIQFCNAGAVLFGVADYVPALMEYVKAYGIHLNFGQTLVSVDGPQKRAVFSQTDADGSKHLVTREFDMLHAVPPQRAPDFVRVSPLADAAGWVDVDPATLRHKQFADIFALGDVANTPNAKTAAAARKQAPTVAHNVLALRGAATGEARYDGYGSCPLTVARGKIVLAEFTYGGKVAPSFPALADRRHPALDAGLVPEGAHPAAAVLGRHAQGPRVDGPARDGGLMSTPVPLVAGPALAAGPRLGPALRPRDPDRRRRGGAHRDRHADPAEPGVCAARGAAAGGGPVRERGAAAAVRRLRQQPRARGRPGGRGLADDGRRHRRACGPGLCRVLAGGHHPGLPLRGDAAGDGRAAAGLHRQLPQPSGHLRLHHRVRPADRGEPAEDADGRQGRGPQSDRTARRAGARGPAHARHDAGRGRGSDRLPVLGAQGAQAAAARLGRGPAPGGRADQGRPGGRHRGHHHPGVGAGLAAAGHEGRRYHPAGPAATEPAELRPLVVARARRARPC